MLVFQMILECDATGFRSLNHTMYFVEYYHGSQTELEIEEGSGPYEVTLQHTEGSDHWRGELLINLTDETNLPEVIYCYIRNDYTYRVAYHQLS